MQKKQECGLIGLFLCMALQLKSKVKEVLSNEMEKIKSGENVDQSVGSC